MKCSFLDYVQLLMIGQAIQVMKVIQNAKKMAAKLSKNEMLIFRLRSTSGDQQSNPSDENYPKYKIMAAKLSKNEMLIFGLCSTSDDWPSNPSDESHPKCKKMAAKLSKNEMLILDYVQLLMIG